MAKPKKREQAGPPEQFTPYYGVEATGHRIGLMQCRRCGAVVILGDPDFAGANVHDQWHRDQSDDGSEVACLRARIGTLNAELEKVLRLTRPKR